MKFKLIFLSILFLYSFNLQSMSFINGNRLVHAVEKKNKEKIVKLLKNNISDKYKSEALYTAISKCDKELVDLLIDNDASLNETAKHDLSAFMNDSERFMYFFKLYRTIGNDQNKFELLCYARGVLFLDRKIKLNTNEDNEPMRQLVYRAYEKYQYESETELKIIQSSTGIEKNCCNLILNYCGCFFTNEDKIKVLRNDTRWLKIIIATLMRSRNDEILRHLEYRHNLSHFGYVKNLINDSKKVLWAVKLILPYCDLEFKTKILEVAEEKRCRKFAAIVQESIAEDNREYIV